MTLNVDSIGQFQTSALAVPYKDNIKQFY